MSMADERSKQKGLLGLIFNKSQNTSQDRARLRRHLSIAALHPAMVF